MKKAILPVCAFLICLWAGLLSCDAAYGQGKLDKFEDSAGVKKTDSSKSLKSTDENSAFKDAKDDDDEEEDDFTSIMFREMLGGMFELLGMLFKEMVVDDHGVRYRAYPYSRENYVFYDKEKAPRGTPGVVGAEYQRISSDLYGLGWRLVLRGGSGFDLSVQGIVYEEHLRSGDHDRMTFSRYRLNGFLGTMPGNIIFRPGAGFAVLGDKVGLDLGFQTDVFFHKPFAFHAGVSHCFIGRGITDIDTGLGVFLGPMELVLGYRGLITRDEQIDGAYVLLNFWF